MVDRDLDALIAEKILGWHEYHVGPDYHGKNECTILVDNRIEKMLKERKMELPPKGVLHRGYMAPSFTGNLNKALELIKIVKLNIPACDIPNNALKIAEMCYEKWEDDHSITNN